MRRRRSRRPRHPLVASSMGKSVFFANISIKIKYINN